MSIKRQTNNNASLQMREGRDSQPEKHSGTHVKTRVIPQGVEISMPSTPDREDLSDILWAVLGILIVFGIAGIVIFGWIRSGEMPSLGALGVLIACGTIGIFGCLEVAKIFFSKEKIIILNNSLTIGKYLFGMRNRSRGSYDITKITNIRVADREGWKQGKICFEYEPQTITPCKDMIPYGEDETQTITLCKDISLAEAKELVRTLADMLSFRCHTVRTIIFGDHPSIERYASTTLQNPDVSDLSTPFFHLEQVAIQTETSDVQQVERFLTYAGNYPGQEYLKAAVNVHIYGDPDKLQPDLRKNFEKLCKGTEVHEKDLSEVKDLESSMEPLHTPKQHVKIRTTHQGIAISIPFITIQRKKIRSMFFGVLCCSGGIGLIILGMWLADMKTFEWGNLESWYKVLMGIGFFGIIGFVAIIFGYEELLAKVFRKQKIVISQGGMTIARPDILDAGEAFKSEFRRNIHKDHYEMCNIHNIRFDVEHTFQTFQTYHLLFDYGMQTIRCCEGISRNEAERLVTLLSDILTFHCHSVERIIFGTYQSPEPDPYTTLQNPDVSGLTTPFFHLQQVVIQTETYDFRLVERFLTYAINSIGNEYLKKNVEIHIYGDAEKLEPNLYNNFQNLCKGVHLLLIHNL